MEIKLLIGLGNPGKEFENTYHNVGQLFVDELAGQDAKFKKEKYFEYIKAGKPVVIKTLTFMNQSGGAAIAAKKYFSVKPDQILIVHDDSDIPLGSFKLSFARSSAGHQGIESIIKSLRTNRFYRLRIGVRPLHEIGRTKANDLVLKKIPKREIKILKDLFREIGLQYLELDGKAYPAVGFRQDA
ncbi:MAG: aminoacyl-tRNA hydrolase [bacterium]|nr:aminoacyl-tRNA hydrolase [bacterium]